MESLSPQVVASAKIPILNPNEFDLWKMRIEQYFLMTDYSPWEVIINGQAQIDMNEAFARQLKAELNANINSDDVIEQVKIREKHDNTVMRYQALKRKPMTEALARKNMMIYLKNMAGFKMDFFKGMTYNEIRPIFEKHYNLNQAFLERVKEEVTGRKEERSKRKGDNLNQYTIKKQRINEEE
nr:ribonuclease H-like domain-containing protein [Tanacetum cinerariifolium]